MRLPRKFADPSRGPTVIAADNVLTARAVQSQIDGRFQRVVECGFEMAVPDFQSLMLPVLRAVADGDVSASDLRSRVAVAQRLSEADLAEMLPSGRQATFANRTAWANIFLQRAGLLEKVSRGVYRITEEGRKVLLQQPQSIDMRFLERYPAYVEWRQRSIGTKPDAESGAAPLAEDQTPEEQIEASHKALR
jgi:restriction system protein